MDDEGLPPIEIVADEADEPRPDEAATRTIRRLRRRQRALAAALAAVAVVGPIAGAAVAGNDSTEEPVSTASDRTDTAAPTEEGGSDTTIEATAPVAEDDAVMGPGAYASEHHAGEPLEWLGAGTTGGVDVRLLLADYGPGGGNPLWDPPPGCFSTGHWAIEASSARFAAALSTQRFEVPGRPDGTVQLVGVAEGDPRWVVMADVDPATAVFTLPDGQEVPAADIAGIALAASPAPGWAEVPHFEDGHRASVTTPAGTFELTSWWYPSEEFHAEHCTPPPPSLPEPGEQPSDPELDRKAVDSALHTVFGDPDEDAKRAVVEHPEVVLDAMEAVGQNYPGITTTAELTDLVFTAPDTAFFLYDLDAEIARFDDQIGEARLVGGHWVITTETICAQLRKGGATCEAP